MFICFLKKLCTMFEYKILLFWARGLILRLKHYCLLYYQCSNITKRAMSHKNRLSGLCFQLRYFSRGQAQMMLQTGYKIQPQIARCGLILCNTLKQKLYRRKPAVDQYFDTLKSRTVDGIVTRCLLKFRTICFRISPISQTSFVKASSSLLNLGELLRTTLFIFCKYITILSFENTLSSRYLKHMIIKIYQFLERIGLNQAIRTTAVLFFLI